MEGEIINRVANSGLVEIDLEQFYPQGKRSQLDMKQFLYQGLILKEKDFRDSVKNYNWEQFKDQYVAVFCSADAIVPTWAYMLVAVSLQPVAKRFVFGDPQLLETTLFMERLSTLDTEKYREAKVIIKGCGRLPVPESAYVEITRLLTPVAQSIMYGEACSTVPLMKKK